MRQRNFAGARDCPTTGQTSIGNRMVRRTKRAPGNQRFPRRKSPRDGIQFGHFQRFFHREGGQNPGNAPRHHRFTRPRRTEKKNIMPASRRDFHGAFDLRLPLHIDKIQGIVRFLTQGGFRIFPHWRDGIGISQQGDDIQQITDGVDIHIPDNRGFPRVFRRDNQTTATMLTRPDRHRQDAMHRADRAIQRKLTHEQGIV